MKNKIIDFFVIIVQISFKVTIIPYYIYSEFPYNMNLLILVNGFVVLALLLHRFKGKIYNVKKLLYFGPFFIFTLLILLQILTGLVKWELKYIIFPITLLFNYIVFLLYLNNLFVFKALENPNQDSLAVFKKVNSFYINFSLFQIILVLGTAILFLFNFIQILNYNIDDLYPQLLGDNVSHGTRYFMQYWSSMMTTNIRLDTIAIGTFTGWTHEPHVFAYLTFPSLFFCLSNYNLQKSKAILIILLFFSACLLSFSTTSFLSVVLVLLMKYSAKIQSFFLFLGILFFGFIIFQLQEIELLESISSNVSNKLFNQTSSAEYSLNNLRAILVPQSAFGDGILLLSTDLNKSGGLLTSFLYIIFYVVLIKKLLRVIRSKDQEFALIGMGFMYFFIHGFKLSSAVFAMPYTVYMLTLFTVFYIYIFKKNKHESFKSY